eukprot:CAMPEP_0196806064 /NCGR_PEP_ID=MMETSP1362-20130617/5923_1 /TAXON_ID=163516 /ORGANISM="Leptocylindrus danicus, Strain CCMP1856" /LENGTH=880 /DNA_ID=CAMNT_0042179357 /DNA_START=458 /DNA_END=3100 /DNA_ORIENTATION=+
MRRTLLATGSNINGRLGIHNNNENHNSNSKSSSVCRALTPISLIRHHHEEEEEEKQKQKNCDDHPNVKLQHTATPAALPSISCGRAHSLLVEQDGQLYGWGCNDFGQVGVETRKSDLVTSKYSSPSSNDAECNVEVGENKKNNDNTSVADSSSSPKEEENLVEGNETEKEEGHAEEEEEEVPVAVIGAYTSMPHYPQHHCDITTPTHIPIPYCGKRERIVQVSCGSQHSLCVTQSGKVYSWGCGAYGATGHGDELTRHRPDLIRQQQQKADHSSSSSSAFAFDNECIVGVCAGQNHSLVLTQHGAVYSFGRGQEGQLGDGYALVSFHNNPQPPTSKSKDMDDAIRAIHCRRTPYRIAFFDTTAPAIILACSNGGHGSYAVLASGGVVRWGVLVGNWTQFVEDSAVDSILQNNAQIQTSTPIPLPCPLGGGGGAESSSSSTIIGTTAAPVSSDAASISSNNNNATTMTAESMVISISAGSNHVICVTRAGEAWSLGSKGPHLGIGPACQYHWFRSPSRMLLPGDVLVNGVSCGERHTLLSTTDGRIFACGDAAFGKLGLMCNEDLEKASDALGAIPKAVPISFQQQAQPKHSHKDVLYGTYVGPMNYAMERVLQHLREEAALALQDAPSQGTIYKNCHLNDLNDSNDGVDVPSSVHVNVTSPRSPELELGGGGSNDNDTADHNHHHRVNDDELSYELDMEYFSATQQTSSGYSNQQSTDDDDAAVGTMISNIQCSSSTSDVMAAAGISSTPNNKTVGWQRRLSYEAKRKLSHGGRMLWGASGAIINNVVTRVTGSHSGDDSIAASSSNYHHHNMQAAAADMSSHHDTTITGGAAADGMIVGSVDSHQDSFDGFLAGKARRKVLLAAGGSSSLVYILDDVSD